MLVCKLPQGLRCLASGFGAAATVFFVVRTRALDWCALSTCRPCVYAWQQGLATTHTCCYSTPCCYYPGISAHQKLELLGSLVRLLGYEGVSVFGDCFDEVTLLDPVRFPGG